jgi:hypothetical protein
VKALGGLNARGSRHRVEIRRHIGNELVRVCANFSSGLSALALAVLRNCRENHVVESSVFDSNCRVGNQQVERG